MPTSNGGPMAADWRDGLEVGERSIIASDNQRELVVTRTCSDKFASQLAAIRFGTSGIRYFRRDVPKQLAGLSEPLFVELYLHGELSGTYVLSSQALVAAGREWPGIYRSGLSIRDGARGDGNGRWLVERTLDWLHAALARRGEYALAWGCIEARNERSRELLMSLGAVHSGRLTSRLVYRQWPRLKVAVVSPAGEAASGIEQAILADPGAAVRPRPLVDEHYRALCSGGRWVAGARVQTGSIRFDRMGFPWDGLQAGLLRFSGAARKRFDPEDFRYLRLTDLHVDADHLACWPDFLTTLLHEFDRHMAMLILDPLDPVAERLAEAGLFGPFSRATSAKVDVLAQVLGADGGAPELRAALSGAGPTSLVPLEA